MNTGGFSFDKSTENILNTLESNGRIPHAIIIEGSDREKTLEAARFLSMYAVCTAENKPCGHCNQCHKASNAAHADIKYAYTEGKSNSYSIKQLREIIADAYIRPNEADAKVYILEEAESRLDVVQQNAILKLIEEPPKNVHFIMTCLNSRRLLDTIRSRCTLVRLRQECRFDEEALNIAKNIVSGILCSREYELLKAVYALTDKEKADDTLSAVSLILRDGLAALSGGRAGLDASLGRKLSINFTKDKLIRMIELTECAKKKITQNININLLTTWLCGEYRRISWQR